jgi:hypothetical protein
MGKRSDLTISRPREVVLILLRREEPAGKPARRLAVSEQTLNRCRQSFDAAFSMRWRPVRVTNPLPRVSR